MARQTRAVGSLPSWAAPAVLVALALVGFQVVGFQYPIPAAAMQQGGVNRSLLDDKPQDRQLAARQQLQTRRKCYDPVDGEPDQRVCVFEDLVLYNGKLLYVTNNASDSVPPIKIAWLKKFEGDDMFQVLVVNQSQLGFLWETAQVEEVPSAWVGHQQHYSNFYHMITEVAPSVHFIMCKFLKDCTYRPDSRTQVLFIQEWRPDIPKYIFLDSVSDTFKCLSPRPVWHKDDEHLKNKVVILRRAVVGVSNEVRAFHEWKDEHKQLYREPPKEEMLLWRQRVADCFGFNFTQAVAPTDPLRILFINRHYREGRSLLNHAELGHLISRMPELAAFPSVDLRMHYLNGEDPIKEQAAQFWNASLLIWPHGATMSLTSFLPRGAQAIEIIPWIEEEKAKQSEWVQAIRDAFSLEIDLYMVQNKDRRRIMFNQDQLLNYPEYQQATPEQKIALLERAECPPGVNHFSCPFWWTHWNQAVNLDWATLEPAVRTALGKLAELRKAGGVMPPRQAAPAAAAEGTLKQGGDAAESGQGSVER